MVAIVTGSSRGIGAAIAKRLAENGVDIAINYVSNADLAEKVAQECRALGVKAEIFKCDVSSFDECEKMVNDVIESMGAVDILVNNAGITRDGLLMRMKEEQFDEVYQANLKSAYNMSKPCISVMMKKRSGRIINISSVAGVSGNAGQTNYSAMKAGLIGFTKALSKEIGSRNVTVNAVAPGFINTDMTEKLSDSIKQQAQNMISLRRFGEANEIANVVAFLASDQASYITGQTIVVDGGLAL